MAKDKEKTKKAANDNKKALAKTEEQIPELPSRQFTKDDEPHPDKSINYFSKPKQLFDALKNVLEEDEWEELRNSSRGIFLTFYKMGITWASRLVHYILGFQLVCNKKHELWSLVGATPIRFSILNFEHITGLNCNYVENLMTLATEVTEEMKDFWEQMGVGVKTGPTYDELVTACELCIDWDREDRLRLGYLSILAACIDAKSHTSAVNVNLVRLVMDLDLFVEYPWGRVAFSVLMTSVKETDLNKSSYHINGFVQALQSWVFFALPKLATVYGVPSQDVRSPPLLAYGGAKGRKNFRSGMLKQTEIITCIRKEYEEMFPQWDDDGEDDRVDNIVKAMYGLLSSRPWKWLPTHWRSQGVLPSTNKPKREMEYVDEGPHKKARLDYSSAEDLEKRLADALVAAVDARFQMFEGVVKQQLIDNGLKITYLTTQVQALAAVRTKHPVTDPKPSEEKEAKPVVGDTQGGSDAKSTTAGDNVKAENEPSVVFLRKEKAVIDVVKKRERQDLKEKATKLLAKSRKEKGEEVPHAVQPVPQIQPTLRGRGYDPFGPTDKTKKIALAEMLAKCPEKAKTKPKQSSSTWWYRVMRIPTRWLWDMQMDAEIFLLRKRYHEHLEWFRSDRICFMDSIFTQLWRSNYELFKTTASPNGSGRVLPPNALDLYRGEHPKFCRSDKFWGVDVDEIYTVLNLGEIHWVALLINIPKRHIMIWDSIVGVCKQEVLVEAVTPICEMLGYVLNSLALPEEKELYPNVPYTWEVARKEDVPQNEQSGDCGVYALKYIECHSLGIPFPKHLLCDSNIKKIREKLAVEVYDELDMKGTELLDYDGLDVYDQK